MNATSHTAVRQEKLLWLALAALTLLATILRALSLFLCMDPIGYFQKGAIPVILFYVLASLILLVCASLFFLINNSTAASAKNPPRAVRTLSAAFPAVALTACAIFLILCASSLPTPAILNRLTALSLLCGTAYFALHIKGATETTHALLGYGALLSATLSIILTYFDRYTQMNAPHKLSLHVCLILVMLALLFEVRNLLHIPLPRLGIATTALAAAICTALSLPNLLAFVGGVYTDPLYAFFDVAVLTLALYFGTKCACFALPPKQEVSQ